MKREITINRERIKYTARLNRFLENYDKRLSMYNVDKDKTYSFKGLYTEAKLLWCLAHKLKLSQQLSVEDVLYHAMLEQIPPPKTLNDDDYLTKKDKKDADEHFNKYLVNFVDMHFSNQKMKFDKNSNHPQPTKNTAFRAFKRELKKEGKIDLSFDAIKMRYKRSTTKD